VTVTLFNARFCEQQKQDCELHDENNDLYKKGLSLTDGTDPMGDSLPSKDHAQEVDLNSQIDTRPVGAVVVRVLQIKRFP
jgi:hypothetical protein